MSKQILVNFSPYEIRVAVLENGEIRSLHIEREEDKNVVGNIYKGVVKRVLPGMQAAFLELGLERTAFLYVDDIIDEPFGGDVEVVDEEEGESSDSSEFDDETSADDEAGGEDEGLDPSAVEVDAETAASVRGLMVTRPSIREADVESDDGSENEGPSEDLDEENDFEADDLGDSEGEPRKKDPLPDPSESRDGGQPPGDDSNGASVSVEGPEINIPAEPREPRRREYNDEPQSQRQDYRDPVDDNRGNHREGAPRDRDRDSQRSEGRGEHRERNDRGDRGGERGDRGGDRGDRGGDRGVSRERGTRSGGRGGRGGGRGGDRGRGQRTEGRGGGRGGRGGGRGGDRGRGGRGGGRGGRYSHRRPRGSANIQDLLKEGQEILVQVAKAPIGTKGARLTTHISLPGRNLVLMPTVKHLGISRRIDSDRERRRLRDIFTKKIRSKDVGFIIRTVAADKSFRELKADAEYLMKMWANVQRDAGKKRAPALVHEDLSLSMRAVRDFFTDDVDSFVIDNAEEFESIQSFIGQFMPRLKSRVKLFKGPSQLFEHYGIEAEISRALGKKVWLKSGGYLLIDQSEALTAIDVNTGRYVGSKSLEETILKTNLEAVKEVAYQLRIRNVGGIIIIDLIDMESMQNRETVYQALQESLGEDRAKTNILKISDLGLVEMTRKRTHEDLIRYLTESCGYCEGRGYHKSKRTICFEIFREIEKEALSANKNIVVFANPDVVGRMTKEERVHVEHLEKRFEKTITIRQDPAFHVEQYEVFGKM